MSEPTIRCPNCKTEIKLTESLAAPLIESMRQDFERRLAQKDADFAKREEALRGREGELAKARQEIDEQVARKMDQERAKISAEEARKAKLALEADLGQKAKEVCDLQEILKERTGKLEEAQKAQVDYLKKLRELEDAKREVDLNVEKRVKECLGETREQARRETEESMKLRFAEKEKTITDMQKQIEDLKRKAEQGSQQLQGEVLELEIETLLGAKFPQDDVQPISKGERGADIMQLVNGRVGQTCGTILWETKRTKNWNNAWLEKLREDQREAKADIAVIVSEVLPKDIQTFDLVEGIWVLHPRVVVPVALALRQMLIEVAKTRQASEGRQTKMDMVYEYLTGPSFRQRIQAIVEAFNTMKRDLDKEKKILTRHWATREKQLEGAMMATVGMYGDLQGIAGKSVQEIEELQLPALEAPDPEE